MFCICTHHYNLHGQMGCAIDGCFCSGFTQMNEQQYQRWIKTMIKLREDDLCNCGHKVLCHTQNVPIDIDGCITLEDIEKYFWSKGCSGCRPFNRCKKFSLSNLKYLEMLYELKENIWM